MLTVQDVNSIDRIDSDSAIDEFAKKVEKSNTNKVNFYGYEIKVTKTTRCVCKDLKCRECGMKVDYILIANSTKFNETEREYKRTKFFTENGTNLTKDHIIPSSKGGTSHGFNLQTLCYFCNEDKDAKMPEDIEITEAFTANFIRRILNGVDRSDLVDLMIRLIKIRRELNHSHPEIFSRSEFLTFFPVVDEERLCEIENEFGNAGKLIVPKNVVSF